jgi:hypothetical protein
MKYVARVQIETGGSHLASVSIVDRVHLNGSTFSVFHSGSKHTNRPTDEIPGYLREHTS